jgi:hypothetical protein
LPLVYKIIYKKYISPSKPHKELFKKVVIAALVAIARQSQAEISSLLASPSSPNIILNMNVQHVEQRVEQKVDVSIDIDAIRDLLDELRQIIDQLEQQSVLYKSNISYYAKRLRKIAAKMNSAIKTKETN